jgi:RNA polymerase sigma-70 factor (ECF subfamily)
MVAPTSDVAVFEQHRPALKRLAYRMLGDTGRAEDIVQEAWIRWQEREVEVDNPRSYLLTIAARLCLNELDSARARREEPRTQLPEPIVVEDHGDVELIEQVSMAFLVALQELTPAERAVLLLHEVFDLSHAQIAEMLGTSEANARQLLRRARQGVESSRPVRLVCHDEHRRLLRAFSEASRTGDVTALVALLAEQATLITDGGPDGARFGRIRNLDRPLVGANKIAAFVTAFATQTVAAEVETREFVLNGQPALVRFVDGKPFAALFLSIADGKVVQVFVQADPARLRRIVAS